jgi:CheY-like chemotaxis protein
VTVEAKIEQRWPYTQASVDSKQSLNGLKVLLVDDDTDGREFAKMLLTEHGAEVRTVGSAAEARKAIAAEVPRVVICDIGLPSEDGYEFMRRLRSDSGSPVAQVPAVALTAYAGIEDQAKALAAGYQKHLAKPVEPAILVSTLQALMREQ